MTALPLPDGRDSVFVSHRALPDRAFALDKPLGITPGSTYNWFFNRNYPSNYVSDWNVTIEKKIASNTLLGWAMWGA